MMHMSLRFSWKLPFWAQNWLRMKEKPDFDEVKENTDDHVDDFLRSAKDNKDTALVYRRNGKN